MAYETYETIQRLWQRLLREELDGLPPEQRRAVASEFESRFSDLLKGAAGNGGDAFVDLVGLGKDGVLPFGDIAYPNLVADFDEAVVPSQLHAAAELYFIYMYERMGVFRVAEVLRRLFRDGRMRIQRGPGARSLYLLEKWQPLRYGPRDRLTAYMRTFNYGKAPRPAGAIVNVNFHFQLVPLMTALAQYFRDLTIGEVIRGEASVPKRGWPDVVAFCDALAAGIDRRRQRSPEAVDALADCARDTLALAAALGALGEPVPFVLTRLTAGETEPDLARCLDDAGIPCRRLGGGPWARRFEAAMAAPLLDSGMATALLAGSLRLAVIQLVAPRAMLSALAEDEDRNGDALDWDACARGDEARHWEGAAAACAEVRCEA